MRDTAAALAGFCQLDANLDVSGKRELWLRDHLNHADLKASLAVGREEWGIFLVNDWREEEQLTVGGTILGYHFRLCKKSGWGTHGNQANNNVPPRFLLQSLPPSRFLSCLSSCLGSLKALWPRILKPNKPLPPQVRSVLYQSHRKQLLLQFT